jgi:electron transfer flavoprotein beta subunit
MKILVCVSKAPDTTSKIAFTNNNSSFDEAGINFIVNPYDEWYALVRALELKEAQGGNVTVLSVGGLDYEQIIRKALAIGADDAVRIDAPEADALSVSTHIANYAKDKGFDLILCGKETINYNGSVVPGMVAELLDMPLVALAAKLDVANGVATCEREVTGGMEVLEVNLPAVISAAKGMAEQRIPNMRGIMAARTKSLQVVAPVSVDLLTSYVNYTMPNAKSAVKMINPENMDEFLMD